MDLGHEKFPRSHLSFVKFQCYTADIIKLTTPKSGRETYKNFTDPHLEEISLSRIILTLHLLPPHILQSRNHEALTLRHVHPLPLTSSSRHPSGHHRSPRQPRNHLPHQLRTHRLLRHSAPKLGRVLPSQLTFPERWSPQYPAKYLSSPTVTTQPGKVQHAAAASSRLKSSWPATLTRMLREEGCGAGLDGQIMGSGTSIVIKMIIGWSLPRGWKAV